MDKRKIINFVKSYPVLYDTTNPDYGDIKIKQDLWNEIAKQLNEKAGKVRNVWNNLKCSYIRVLKKKMLGDTLAKKWQYEDDLEFIYPSVEGKIRTDDDGSEFEVDMDSSASESDDQYISENSENVEENQFDEKALIQAVKSYPVLYNLDDKGNRSKFEAWKGVAERTSQPVRKCQRHWKILRAQYTKILKNYEQTENKRLRWKYSKEMEFMKPFLKATLSKKTKKKYPTSTMEFFVSMANIVKKLPQTEQEAIETLILDMITETEIEYQKELVCKSNENEKYCLNQPNESTESRDAQAGEEEFVQRVKFETQESAENALSNIADDPLKSCFTNDVQTIDPNITPTEQYVVKVIPEPESCEIQEEYIINVLPDSAAIDAPQIKAEVKEEVDMKEEFEFKGEPEEENAS